MKGDFARNANGFVIGIDTMIAITLLGSAVVYFMYEYTTAVQTSSVSAGGALGNLNANSKLQGLVMLLYGNSLGASAFESVANGSGYELARTNFSSVAAINGSQDGRLMVIGGSVYEINRR